MRDAFQILIPDTMGKMLEKVVCNKLLSSTFYVRCESELD